MIQEDQMDAATTQTRKLFAARSVIVIAFDASGPEERLDAPVICFDGLRGTDSPNVLAASIVIGPNATQFEKSKRIGKNALGMTTLRATDMIPSAALRALT